MLHKKSKNILLYLSLFVLLSSCRFYGITNDYSTLSNEEKQLIDTCVSFDNLEPKKIYVINGKQLKNEIKNNENSMVYIFTNGCPSEYCFPMSVYESYAKENDIKLYLVMTGYASLQETLQQKFESPLFAIDYDYYETKYRSTAVRKFENDLRERPSDFKDKNYEGNILFFKKDKLIEVMNELPQ